MTSEASIKEIENFDTQSVGIATTTFYKKWYPGLVISPDTDVDKIRGDIAIQMFQTAVEAGYQIVNVDGGSSDAFLDTIEKLNIKLISPEHAETGMSPSRRQALKEVSAMSGVEIICWTEPEKISMISDCLKDSAKPIVADEADIVVPCRTMESLNTYPEFQVDSEQLGNKNWNGILRRFGILKPDSPDLDVFFGPKLFRNSPDILSLFLTKYDFDLDNTTIKMITKVENYSNAIFFPIIAALYKGLRVVSVGVDYRHPEIQTKTEKDSPDFVKKRKAQRSQIISSAIEFCRYLTSDKKSRIKKQD